MRKNWRKIGAKQLLADYSDQIFGQEKEMDSKHRNVVVIRLRALCTSTSKLGITLLIAAFLTGCTNVNPYYDASKNHHHPDGYNNKNIDNWSEDQPSFFEWQRSRWTPPLPVGCYLPAVDNLIRRKINILFVVGGDGTQRGGNELYQEAKRRGYALSVVGIPKTIDNDVAFVSRSFGYVTAVNEAAKAISCAHTEAHSVLNGISVVKIMGRHAGFIAAGATVASQEVNFTLVPEMPFKLYGEDGFLAALKRRVERRAHAVILVAEGAGQHLMNEGEDEFDASGNVKFKDIGPFLREKIEAYMKAEDVPYVIRYMDPSYIVRSVPASSEDAILCDFYARNAVHAAMAGKTGLVIGQQHDVFTHVPSELLTKHKKQLSLNSTIWRGVLACTGQNFASVT